MNENTKTDCLRKLYNAHETISDINERLKQLYDSATSITPSNSGENVQKTHDPKRFESLAIEIADLKRYAQEILKNRAKFDLFACSLTPFYRKILNMRCEGYSFKEISIELKISYAGARRIFNRICANAKDYNIFGNNSPSYEPTLSNFERF